MFLKARIYYGNRVHYLSTKATAPEIRKIMDSMCLVVQTMLKRLQADLAEDEIAIALQAFNVESWQQRNRHQMLKQYFQRLCKALRVGDRSTASSLAAVAQTLARVFEAAKKQALEVTNRIGWSWALDSRWRNKYLPRLAWTPECQQLVEFYLSLKLNTTTLERDLSELLAQLSAHSGPLSSCGSTISSILEVSLEGPQREEDLFLRSEAPGGPLVPTDFARLCAKLWLQHFGRRFRFVYRKEPATADGRKGPRSKVHGQQHDPRSLVGRLQGRTQAASNAAARSGPHESFVPGLRLPLSQPAPPLPGTRWASAMDSSAKASLENFVKNTDRKKQRTCVGIDFPHCNFLIPPTQASFGAGSLPCFAWTSLCSSKRSRRGCKSSGAGQAALCANASCFGWPSSQQATFSDQACRHGWHAQACEDLAHIPAL